MQRERWGGASPTGKFPYLCIARTFTHDSRMSVHTSTLGVICVTLSSHLTVGGYSWGASPLVKMGTMSWT